MKNGDMTSERVFGPLPRSCGGADGRRRTSGPRAWALGVALCAGALAMAAFGATEVARLAPSDGSGGFGRSVALSGEWLAVGLQTTERTVYLFERAASGEWVERQRLSAPDELADDYQIGDFGAALALEGERLLVGAWLSDVAYVYERDAAGVWTERARLTPPEGAAVDGFGNTVALSGDRLAIGALRGRAEDAVFVFERTAEGNWAEAAMLVPDDLDTLLFDSFGESIALEGERLVVGATIQPPPDSGDYRQLAYVFERDAAGGWTQTAKLSPPGIGFLDRKGVSVGLSGERIVLGVDTDENSAYVYERRDDGGWASVATLEPLVGNERDGDGMEAMTIDLDGDRVVMGGYNTYGATSPGSVFVFERDAAGSWAEVERLRPMDSGPGDQFGYSVSLEGDRLAVGDNKNGPLGFVEGQGETFRRDPGAVYVFEFSGAADADGDGVSDAADRCPVTAVPEARVPALGQLLGRRFALRGERDGAGTARFTNERGRVLFSIERTRGCSCGQLLARRARGIDPHDHKAVFELFVQWLAGCDERTLRRFAQPGAS